MFFLVETHNERTCPNVPWASLEDVLDVVVNTAPGDQVTAIWQGRILYRATPEHTSVDDLFPTIHLVYIFPGARTSPDKAKPSNPCCARACGRKVVG
jgi:hypothetical protein